VRPGDGVALTAVLRYTRGNSASVAPLGNGDAVPVVTVIVNVPDLPPADAVMIAVPAFKPLMSPDDETPATVGALLDHVTVVLSFAPLGSRTVAAACSV
jgi:hypothetical protein